MVSKCANPECQVPFLHLSDGKLFMVPRLQGPSTKVHFFWVCIKCAEIFKPPAFVLNQKDANEHIHDVGWPTFQNRI